VDIDTYVDNMYLHTEIVCEREGHATWFEEILFIYNPEQESTF